MGRPRNPDILEKNLGGFKHFKLLLPVLEKLRPHRCGRDKAGNRTLHYDQYAALILLYFFNPIVTGLRGIQQASELRKVQRKLGRARASLGSLSEAARVFDADLLRGVIGELVNSLPAIQGNTQLKELRGVLTLVGGTLLPALPKIVEAMWRDSKHQAFKLHTHIACLLIALWTGHKPTLRTCEMICHYFTGLAGEEELLAHIQKLAPQS